MDIQGEKAYLSIDEQKRTGYPSPIDLESFDLHGERVATDAERDRLTELSVSDPDQLSSQERASVPLELARVEFKSNLLREIAKEKGRRAGSVELIDEVENFLKDNPTP